MFYVANQTTDCKKTLQFFNLALRKNNFLNRLGQKIIPNLDKSKLAKSRFKLKSNLDLASADLT